MSPRKLIAAVAVVSLALGFVGGLGFYKYQFAQPAGATVKELINQDEGQPGTVDFSLFWQAWEKLHEMYVDSGKLDTQQLVYGAVSGMVNAVGDPYTEFFPPEVSKKFQEQISGSFSGVGMEIGMRNNILTVIAPIKDTPAYRAGIGAGDQILKIDDTSTEGMAVDEAVTLIRGRKGTHVRLTLLPSGSTTPREVEIIRDTIRVPAVDFKMLDDHTAYIELSTFSQNIDADFKNAANEALSKGATAVVIDLRSNPGGLLDSAVDLAGYFLDKGSLVVTEDFGNGEKNEFRADGNASLKQLKTVFLVDGGSASASEILSGAVHDDRGITLVGTQTFGKGSVQQLEQFRDGSSLKVTIAKWLTPSGVSISEKGITPDIVVELSKQDAQDGKYEFGTPGKDPQLDRALEVLR